MSENNIDCNLKQLHVGVHTLETGSFEFNRYTSRQIQESVDETKEIFESVHSIYRKKTVA